MTTAAVATPAEPVECGNCRFFAPLKGSAIGRCGNEASPKSGWLASFASSCGHHVLGLPQPADVAPARPAGPAPDVAPGVLKGKPQGRLF